MRTAVAFSFLVFVACEPEPTPLAPASAAAKPSAVTSTGGARAAVVTTSIVPATSNQPPVTNTTRHLPGTAITTATGKYIYLVQSDGTLAPFASAAVATASGYPTAMVVTVTSSELYCYGRGDQITSALPAPASGKLRNGALVKEKGKSDTYVVSDGVAWPIINGTVFIEAGYDWDNVVELAAGALAGSISSVGNCVSGDSCLDEAYLMTCAQDETIEPTSVATSSATSVATSSATSVITASAIATETSVATVTATSVTTAPLTSSATSIATATVNTQTATATITSAPTNTHTASATAVATSAPTVSETATATSVIVTVPTVSTTVTNTVTATAFSPDAGTPDAGSPDAGTPDAGTPDAGVPDAGSPDTAVDSQPPSTEVSFPPTIDLSWVWSDGGAELCLNAAYFAGDDKAVLLVWSGPNADAAKGPVAIESGGRFCWDFTNKGKGLYYFWSDVPLSSCSADICARDTTDGNGAMYMTAPKATAAAHKWLHCETTGCDGAAYWDGAALTPMGD